MKFFISIILTALAAFAAGIYLPWWCMALVAFLIAAFIRQHPLYAFAGGFISIFLLWGILAYLIDTENQSILSAKIGLLLGTGPSSLLLVFLTALIGGLIAGLSALSASLLFKKA